jgi:hypothetical protein
VVWDEEPRVGRRQAPRARATVFLKPEPGATIGFDTVQAVRAAVSGSRAHLAADDVLVMDLQRRATYGPETDSTALADEQQRTELIAACRSRIEAALSDFAGAEVIVFFDPARPSASVPSPSTRHTGIAGMSGPNLRLEVARVPEEPSTAPASESSAQPPQLSVTVTLPAACLADRSINSREATATRHRSHSAEPSSEALQLTTENEVRQLVARAIAGLPVALNLRQLNIAWDQPETSSSVSANADVHAGSAAWTDLNNAAAAFIVDKPGSAILFLVAITVLAWWFVRRRRNNDGMRTSPASRAKPSPQIATPIEFLSGIAPATWAPLVALEPTPVVAGLLRRLPPDDVALVISHLTAVQQRDVLELAPSAEFGTPDVEALERRVLAAVQKNAPESPVHEPMRRPPVSAPVIRRSTSTSESPAVFDDLLAADEASLRRLASCVPVDTWSAALIGASPKLQRRLSRLNLAVGRPREGTDRRPIRLREIESAQRMIIDEWQALQVPG